MSSTTSPPTEPEATLRLPRATYHLVLHTLRGLLPPPTSDTPQDLARRDDAAIAQVAAMLPVNADEAHLAAQCVGARARAAECMRLACEQADNLPLLLQCNAQAARMAREANTSRALLLRLQTERRQREAEPAGASSASWSEHCAIGWLTQAAADPSPVPPHGIPSQPLRCETDLAGADPAAA